MYQWNKQLAVGNKGEQLIKDTYPNDFDWFVKSYASDFIYKKSNTPTEVKTDTYSINKTPNFFIERYSKYYDRSPGGPWQAWEKGSRIFIYFFINDRKLFVFKNLQALIVLVEDYTAERETPLIEVPNDGYITLGYKIPRKILSNLYEEVTLGEPIKSLEV
jgi:hypothetical protein